MSVCLSVHYKVEIFNLLRSNQSAIVSEQSVSTQRALRKHSESNQGAIREHSEHQNTDIAQRKLPPGSLQSISWTVFFLIERHYRKA